MCASRQNIGAAPHHELVDHPSEIVLRLWAPSLPDLLVEAARGFAELVPPHLGGTATPGKRLIEIESRGQETALVDWLNELVYLAETEGWIPTQVEIDVQSAPGDRVHVEARAQGRTLTRPFVLVKAATLHDLRMGPSSDGLRAEVTLDI